MTPNSSFVNCVLQNNIPYTGTHPHLHNLLWQKGVCRYGSVEDMRLSRLPHWAGDKNIRVGKGHMREAEVTVIWRYHPVSLENGSKEGRKLVDHNSHKKLAPSTIKTTVSWCILLSLGKKKVTVYQVASQTQHCDYGPPTFRGKCPSQIAQFCDSWEKLKFGGG